MPLGASDNLILTGFMGVGKTAVGREIARRLGRGLVDIDGLIEAREHLTVSDIFAQRGEACFRRLETSLCHELAARSGLVIATGGGALITDGNREILGASGPVVCLTASVDEILRRLESTDDRPLLDAPDRRRRVANLMSERAAAYARIPLAVDTTGLTVEQVADQVLAVADTPPTLRIPVRHSGSEYTIHLGRGLLSRTGRLLRDQSASDKVALVTNPNVGARYAGSVVESLQAAGYQVATCLVPDGEAHKSLDTAQSLYDRFIEAGLDRWSAVVALGGGVIGDLAGFAAATYLRGVPLVQVPTTLLAMVDASVGGKVAVNHRLGKNLIGAFKQPAMVIADLDGLSSLPAAELAHGLAEVVKAGIVGDPWLFEQIEAYGPAPLRWAVERAIRVKRAIVEDDPYERGLRMELNLGHTFGHALETLNGYAISHGAAVSIGMVAATRLSARLGLCSPDLLGRVEGVLERLGLPTRYKGHTSDQIWRAMTTDKKAQAGRLRFVLPRALGDVFVTDQVAQAEVVEVLKTLWAG